MAASSASGYGVYNPNAVDPFPVEQTLAQIVGQNNPAEAYNMLKTYQTQNETSRGNYDYAMQGQHEFAKQQLAQQLKEQYIKSAMDAVQHPGGLSVLQGMAPDALANVDPGVIGGVETGLARAQDASTFEKGASGAYHAVQAGFPPDATGLARLTGGVTGAAGTPLQMQIEAMKEAHADARATASAARVSKDTVIIRMGMDENGYPIERHVKIPENATDEQVQGVVDRVKRQTNVINPQGGGVPGATQPGDTAPAPPPAPRRPVTAPTTPPPSTSLQPMAQRDPGTSGTLAAPPANTAQPASKQFITDTKAQGLAARGLQYLPPDAKLDVGANVQGKIIPIVPLTGGGAGYVGKSGKVYTLPKPGQQQ